MDMMMHALELASAAAQAGEVPVGAVITDSHGAIVATAQNRMRRDNNALAHAEFGNQCRIAGHRSEPAYRL